MSFSQKFTEQDLKKETELFSSLQSTLRDFHEFRPVRKEMEELKEMIISLGAKLAVSVGPGHISMDLRNANPLCIKFLQRFIWLKGWALYNKTEDLQFKTVDLFYKRDKESLKLVVWLGGETVCRVEQVGTETVEKPIYKMVCEEGLFDSPKEEA